MFEYKKSPIHGNGIFATEKIKPEQKLFQTHVIAHGFDLEWVNIKPNCMYNHSKNANCKSVTEGSYKFLMSITEIQIGEELLVDFTEDKDLEQPQKDWKY
tara:strand:+ start:444 stop:743 length:300 start_codon:yes stop_codon:yes gene_type:complete